MYLLFVFITTVSGQNMTMHLLDQFDTISDCENYAPKLIDKVSEINNIYDISFECFNASEE